jgi:hypothetical protein
MKKVLITWEDIESHMVWNEEPEDVECPTFETLGFLMELTNAKVVICDTDPGYGQVTVFPRGAVVSIEYL